MLTTLGVLVLTLTPIVAVVALLELTAWLERRRELAVARQITLTDAIAGELGAVVAPVVTKPLWGPWQIRIAVPLARPAAVGTIIAIAHRVFAFAERMNPGDYHIVLTPQEEWAAAPRPTLASRVYTEAA